MPLLGVPSFAELIIIFGVIFLLFGAKKLPELGGAIGESIKNFKKGLKEDDTSKQLPDTSASNKKPTDTQQDSDKQNPPTA
ncbi:MAG: twin-arginine translocase TatA/TatE family subunit [Proteobacteria bacterium]|nr:twin-arginine translocase TatA/TatE family subunit [Pseudomonadota bacterium]